MEKTVYFGFLVTVLVLLLAHANVIEQDDNFEIVFKTCSGTGESPLLTWETPGELEGNHMIESGCSGNTYKSPQVDQWQNVDRVKTSWFKDGEEVAWVVFDGTNTDYKTWFDQSRMLETSFEDLSTKHKLSHFSLHGSAPTNPESANRTFYINAHHGGGCDNDWGWVGIPEKYIASEMRPECGYEKVPEQMPLFLYCPGNKLCRFDKHVQYADTLAIFISNK